MLVVRLPGQAGGVAADGQVVALAQQAARALGAVVVVALKFNEWYPAYMQHSVPHARRFQS